MWRTRIAYTQRRDASADDGFTLIELLVYSLLLGLVLMVVGGIMISTQAVEKRVRDTTSLTTAGQLAADSIETGIRNSSDFRIVNLGANRLLVARTAGGADALTWSCSAWYYTAGSPGNIRYTTFASNDATAAMVVPPAGPPTNWMLLADGIDTPGATEIFTGAWPQLTIAFTGEAVGETRVTINTSALSRAETRESESCFTNL